MIEKIGHYSLTNPSSVYDEEAMTALELAGRTAGKVNEVIDEMNTFINTTAPGVVSEEIEKLIETGIFDEKLDEYVDGGAFAVQEKNLYDYMSQMSSKSFKLNHESFERGSWNNNDVPNNNASYRVRTKEAIHFPFDVMLTPASGFRIGGYLCDAFGNSETSIDWTTDPYHLPAKQKIKLIIAKVDEDETTMANVAPFVDQITVISSIEADLESLNETIEQATKHRFWLGTEKFKNGSIQGWVDGSFSTSYPYRVATPDLMTFPFDTVVSVASGFKYALAIFSTAGKFELDTGWLTGDYLIPEGKQFRVMIGQDPEDTAIIATIRTFVHKVWFTNYQVKTAQDGNLACTTDFNFVFGAIDKGAVKSSFNRIVTKDILYLPYGVTIKANPNIKVAVFTYTDGQGGGAKDLGWVVQDSDYMIPENTYFRLMVATYSYADELPIYEKNVVDTLLYKSVKITHYMNENVDVLTPMEQPKKVVNEALKKRQIKIPSTPRVRDINHRGANCEAPENTIPALIQSKKNGFDFVECDVWFTSDLVPVIIHDATINRTARRNDTTITGDKYVMSSTYQELLTYDFGVWFDPKFAGTKIPTFEEFMTTCKRIGVHPYIEIQDVLDDNKAKILVDIVKNCGMVECVTWISFAWINLQAIQKIVPNARLGFNMNTAEGLTTNHLLILKELQKEGNEIFANADHPETCVEVCSAHGIPLECWGVAEDQLKNIPPYVSGVTTDRYKASEEILFDQGIGMGKFTFVSPYSGEVTYEFEFPAGMIWHDFVGSPYATTGNGTSFWIDTPPGMNTTDEKVYFGFYDSGYGEELDVTPTNIIQNHASFTIDI